MIFPLGLLALMVASAMVFLPPLARTETRYLAVAWEMWHQQQYLVPYLNGEVYSHKPPVLFWAINLIWTFFGVHELAARLVAPAFSFGTVLLIGPLAHSLWPRHTDVARLVPLVLVGTMGFSLYSMFTMMDSALTFFTALGWLALVRADRQPKWQWWAVFAVAAGLGVLTKGPVIYLFLLAPMLLRGLWSRNGRTAMGRHPWIWGFGTSLVVSVMIALAWAIPAAIAGGETFANEIFLQQTAGRLSGDFGHPRPWWWYFPFLPLLLFPWIFWPALWRGMRAQAAIFMEPGARFCLSALFIPFIAFIVIGGKQAHYLMPLMVPAALLITRLVVTLDLTRSRQPASAVLWVAAGFASIGVIGALATTYDVTIFAPLARFISSFPAYVQAWSLTGPVLLFLALATLFFLRPTTREGALRRVVVTLVAVTLCIHIEFRVSCFAWFDLTRPAEFLAAAELDGRQVAVNETYYGQFHFKGRLKAPFTVVTDAPTAVSWAQDHPEGIFLQFFRGHPENLPAAPEALFPYKKRQLAAWPAPAVNRETAPLLYQRNDG